MTDLPIKKNRSWVALLHQAIDSLDEPVKAEIMKACGEGCSADIIALAERFLGIRIETVDHLVAGWNLIREQRGLTGRWEYGPEGIRGIFQECGCPLVRSGLIGLHPVQCYCSQGMMESIFSRVAGRKIEVEIKGTIGRGDKACHFLVKSN